MERQSADWLAGYCHSCFTLVHWNCVIHLYRSKSGVKIIKHVSGILLATAGVLFVFGSVAQLLNRESEIPLWGSVAFLIFLGLAPLAGAAVLLRKAVTTPTMPCPKCGSTECQAAGVLRKSHNPWMFHFGGWLLSSLWGASREKQVRCVQCETLYLANTRGSRIAGILLWIMLLLILSGLLADHFA